MIAPVITRTPHPPIDDHFAEGKAIARQWFVEANTRVDQYRLHHLSQLEGRTEFLDKRKERASAWQAGFEAGFLEVLSEISGEAK